MTSAMNGWGRGVPKSRKKEQNQLMFDSDKERGGGTKNLKILRTAYMEASPPPKKKSDVTSVTHSLS